MTRNYPNLMQIGLQALICNQFCKSFLLLIEVSLFTAILFSLKAQPKYQLVELREYASCTDFELQKDNVPVQVPERVKTGLQCPSVLDLHNNRFLTFLESNEIMQYDLLKDTLYRLFGLYADIDGISNPAWSCRGKMLFVIINQAQTHNYKSFARLIVINVKHGKVIEKRKFDRPVHFFCASICSAIPESDFKFINENTIAYRRHRNIEKCPGEWKKISLKKK